ncbi:MAG: hypothetical protein FWH57_13270, partial [Oscillospiraceae bacterium]|nr:hypothetical protein [Oscillospiraceae bacterium]
MKKQFVKHTISLLLVLAILLGMLPPMQIFTFTAHAAGAGSSALMVSGVYGQREIGLLSDGEKYLPAYPMFLDEPNTVSFTLPNPGLVQFAVYSADALNAAGYSVPAPPPSDWLRESESGWLDYAEYEPQNLPDDWLEFLDGVEPIADLTGPAGVD